MQNVESGHKNAWGIKGLGANFNKNSAAGSLAGLNKFRLIAVRQNAQYIFNGKLDKV
jgi:hypothetical protein